jgi:protein-S-isoprenylcysteine O-methyltransferase Ste14
VTASRQARPKSGASPSRARRISPGVVILALALIGSVAYVLFAITVRDPSQIPLLTSGAVVLGIVFAALAVYCARGTWRAGLQARNGRAILLGLCGGIAAMISAGCFAGAAILFLT